MTKISIIGSGFSGLSAACTLAQGGFDVTVFEKNDSPGGRARKFESDGFMFDMGPSWYWMPEVFENFFNRFGKKSSSYYELRRLDPSYRIYFGKNDYEDIPAGVEGLKALFERLEAGSGDKLAKFLQEGKFKYEAAFSNLIFKSGLSVFELMNPVILRNIFKLHVFQSVSGYIRKFFKNPRIIQILEFPVLFLGATPQNTPALYSLMNYADMALGTWYPMGGMYKIVEGMVSVAAEMGVKFRFGHPVSSFEINQSRTKGLMVGEKFFSSDYIVAGADYNHVEQNLLPRQFRNYSAAYWDERVLAPSSLIFYLGINKKLPGLQHHNLFFDQDFGLHAEEIYKDPQWPTSPQFYVSCPSRTDASVAPDGDENLMILMPVAPGLRDNETIRDKYFNLIIDRIEHLTGEQLRNHIVFKRSYAHNDFILDYNSYKGNAYGLANTLFQTANFKPSIRNKKISNLFYTGQLTVPGPGVPPSIISGQVVAQELIKSHSQKS